MHIQRRQELKWELVDTLFTKWEYWSDYNHGEELTDVESKWMKQTIASIAKRLGVTNHICID